MRGRKRQTWMLWMKNECNIGKPTCLDKCKVSSRNTFAAAALLLGLPFNAPSPWLEHSFNYSIWWQHMSFISFHSLWLNCYIYLLYVFSFSLSILHVPFFSVWASSTSAGRHFASTHNGAFLFVVRIRFRFVNEMELNEMYNLLYLGDFGSQCAMRKTKPKSHFRFLFLCNIYSNICKLMHTRMYIHTYGRVYCWV